MYELASASNTIAAGTGFTSTASGNIVVVDWSGIGYGTNPCRIEWESSVAAGSNACTFTDATNGGGTQSFVTIFAALKEGSAAPILPILGQILT
jgi:hypothetical protein